MKRRVPRLSIDPRLKTALITFLIKVIGETIKDRLLRAAIVGVVTVASQSPTTEQAPPPSPPAVSRVPDEYHDK